MYIIDHFAENTMIDTNVMSRARRYAIAYFYLRRRKVHYKTYQHLHLSFLIIFQFIRLK